MRATRSLAALLAVVGRASACSDPTADNYDSRHANSGVPCISVPLITCQDPGATNYVAPDRAPPNLSVEWCVDPN